MDAGRLDVVVFWSWGLREYGAYANTSVGTHAHLIFSQRQSVLFLRISV